MHYFLQALETYRKLLTLHDHCLCHLCANMILLQCYMTKHLGGVGQGKCSGLNLTWDPGLIPTHLRKYHRDKSNVVRTHKGLKQHLFDSHIEISSEAFGFVAYSIWGQWALLHGHRGFWSGTAIGDDFLVLCLALWQLDLWGCAEFLVRA